MASAKHASLLTNVISRYQAGDMSVNLDADQMAFVVSEHDEAVKAVRDRYQARQQAQREIEARQVSKQEQAEMTQFFGKLASGPVKLEDLWKLTAPEAVAAQ